MKKRFLAILLTCTMIFGAGAFVPLNQTNESFSLTASAEEGTYGNLVYYNNGEYIEITGCDDKSVEIVDIPAEIDGLPVKGIFVGAFSQFPNLTTVRIPDSVTEIWEQAFYYCEKLNSVNIPDSVTSIGNGAFLGCKGLTDIVIGNGVTSIGDFAFQRCTNLESVTRGNSVTYIGLKAFAECRSLTSFVIPDGITHLDAVFPECTRLKTVTIPESVVFITRGAFYDCRKLTDVYYRGTEEQWDTIRIDDDEKNRNAPLLDANIHFDAPLEISVVNLVALNQCLKSSKNISLKYDMNGDNVVNVIDLALLKRALLNQ